MVEFPLPFVRFPGCNFYQFYQRTNAWIWMKPDFTTLKFSMLNTSLDDENFTIFGKRWWKNSGGVDIFLEKSSRQITKPEWSGHFGEIPLLFTTMTHQTCLHNKNAKKSNTLRTHASVGPTSKRAPKAWQRRSKNLVSFCWLIIN